MPSINKANRQVCDVDFRDVATMRPVMFFETANTTTQEIQGDSVYAMAKGAKKIAFANPISGTASIEAQVYPFEFYSLFTDGVVESTGSYPEKKVIKCTTEGELEIPEGAVAGTVFAFANGDFGGVEIAGTFADGKFTANTASDIAVDAEYEVGYIMSKNGGVKRISFNNKKMPKAYYISMNTVEKDEDDVLTPYKIILYKAQPQRNFSLSQSSEGDPASISMSFELLEDKDGNFVDMIEIIEE